ncbi:N-acetyltransferase [Pseudarthrobacter cellobiosi]|uniref:N-acetyltransferase n=1 Tax=Pseudarthrobacter cellobiosi TaxID=2953654 RepID=UPI00208F2DBC|nr:MULTISPECIES: N-acetyltransferase [unclassified Pseudarthrobacter]MCO4254443.1 N-acetyltransferase [Pseudarthrobacter sp. HLT1-5]MCO4274489.1 N-acetyltransferase [Pseudarthrobacter sp. HLT3-5]
MTGEKNLQTLLATLKPVLREGEYVYVLWPHGRPLEPGIEAAVREAGGLTVVLPRERADSLGLHYDFVAAWITLEVHSALEAVGLTAAVGKALTDAKISCNVLAGFHHDHLLVPVADAPRAVEALAELSAASRDVPRPELLLRNETAADRDKILALTGEAFAVSPVTGLPVAGEPEEVDVLRRLFECEDYLPEFSVVAVLDDEIVGHVISTRGWVGDYGLLGLGPIGVTPRLQRHGIGTALMNDTIARANAAGEGGIALLGSTEYYPRFGFVPAASFGVLPPDEAWGDRFQLLPLAVWPGGVHGTFRYAGPLAGE